MKITPMKNILILLSGTHLAMTCVSQAAVTLFAEYHLGEAGSLGTNNRPVDSAGVPQNFASDISGGTVTVGTTGVFAPGSSAYLDTSNTSNQGWYAADFSSLPTSDFAFGIYARASALADGGDVFTVGGANGAIKLSLGAAGWAASINNVAWIGTPNGTVGSFTANQWVHLAVVRTSTESTFYINGVAQSGTSASTPVNGVSHLSVNPGGTAFFDGHLDEARVVTFTGGESTANIFNALTTVPEPSAAALLGGLGVLSLLRRRRH